MNRLAHIVKNRQQRRHRVRAVVVGTTERPRLSVHISHQHVTAQLIDDSKQATLAYASTVGQKQATTLTMTAKATQVGTEIARKALAIKKKRVVFDRGSRIYHGRVAALAEAARQEGLEF